MYGIFFAPLKIICLISHALVETSAMDRQQACFPFLFAPGLTWAGSGMCSSRRDLQRDGLCCDAFCCCWCVCVCTVLGGLPLFRLIFCVISGFVVGDVFCDVCSLLLLVLLFVVICCCFCFCVFCVNV